MEYTPIPPERLRSSLPAVDIGGFFEAVSQAFKLHLATKEWPAATQPVLIESFPKERLANPAEPFDVITWSVAEASMAPTDNAGQRIPRAPVLRERAESSRALGYNEATIAWKELVTVVFQVYSRSNKHANDMVNAFHRFMMTYAHGYKFFSTRGVDFFRFAGRKADEVTKVAEGQEVYKRTLTYEIRIEYLQVLLEKQLEYVTINAINAATNETDSIDRP
jgi:hypothetical protein